MLRIGPDAGVHELERCRLARDLHDECGQHVTALRLHVELLRERAAGTLVQGDLERLQGLTIALERSLDAVASWLRPPSLDGGLGAALASLAAGWTMTGGVPVDTSGLEDDSTPLPDDLAVQLYRIAQEALHNVFKHAKASSVRLRLLRQPALLCLAIEDDGVGFTEAQVVGRRRAGGYGHASLRQRAASLGGTLQIRSAPGRGTALTLTVPVPEPADYPVPLSAGSVTARAISNSSRTRR